MFFVIQMPVPIKSRQPPRLAATLIKNNERLPYLSRSSDSALNVENVLKPPQNPIAIRKRSEFCISGLFIDVPRNSPSTNDAIKFEINVPKGNDTNVK